jgi:predicted nucleotidyltransferase
MAMRLSPTQIDTIKRTAAELFGVAARVSLFGSRVDDSLKGGDIDLLVELPEDQPELRRKSLTLVARLQMQLGDQPIDVLVATPDTPDQPILRAARGSGVPL